MGVIEVRAGTTPENAVTTISEAKMHPANPALDAFLDEALLPPPDAALGLSALPHDLVRAETIGRKQHDLGPPTHASAGRYGYG